MNLIQLALRRPYTFIVMAMLIVLATPFALLKMPTDILPEINIPVISIVWNYTGMSAQEMGQRITSQNERSLTTTVSDIEHIESQTLAGIAVIKIFFQPNANIQTALAQVTAIEQAQLRQLPPGITPPLVIKYSASSIPVVQLGLSSGTLPEQFDLRRRRQHPAPAVDQHSRRRDPVPVRRQEQADLRRPGHQRAAGARAVAVRRRQRRQPAEPDPAVGHREVRTHRIHGEDERLDRHDRGAQATCRCAPPTA